jgi:hypothetical protein
MSPIRVSKEFSFSTLLGVWKSVERERVDREGKRGREREREREK